MTDKKQKLPNENYYQTGRFTDEQLAGVLKNVGAYAEAIGGLPQNHAEALEKRGWMLPFLLVYDDLLWGRWEYWARIMEKGTIEGSGPIPQIIWANLGDSGVIYTRKMLTKCMDYYESTIDHFADWLLWGLGGAKEPPKISAKLNEHYYRNFDLFLILNYPTDYLSQLLSEQTGRGYKGALGYFPTPFHVTQMMTELTLAGEDPEELKKKTVNDPCVGCGAFLLPASNHYLRAYGMDISGIAVKLCSVQMFWFAPWYARVSESIKGFDTGSKPVQLSFDGLWKTA